MLYFEIRLNGKPVDPVPYLSGVKVISEILRSYNYMIIIYLKLLIKVPDCRSACDARRRRMFYCDVVGESPLRGADGYIGQEKKDNKINKKKNNSRYHNYS